MYSNDLEFAQNEMSRTDDAKLWRACRLVVDAWEDRKRHASFMNKLVLEITKHPDFRSSGISPSMDKEDFLRVIRNISERAVQKEAK